MPVRSTRSILKLRADVRTSLRGLFDGLGFLEVDTPVLLEEVLPEPHIEPIAVALDGSGRPVHYLQASPEAMMKRLLAAGSGSIYQFARSFRAGERGRWHSVEFVLLEWYAPGTTLDETAAVLQRLCAETLNTAGLERITCSDAFQKLAGVDPLTASLDEWREAGHRAGLELPRSHTAEADDWFEMILSEVLTPRLGRGRPTMLESWPASQAAFAKIDPCDRRIARRFELFVEGVELANGWEEETSREVLRERIDAANQVRAADRRGVLPLPLAFLEAHGDAMPSGVGVALGFDRLVMLKAGADSIHAVRCV